ncbi:extended synaptotagmin-2-A isoform X1 [Poecilia reticulata]|uniref:extended synaptotagmin-2-A isoform X1 n=1 Tax=Poecilia reticulata TaxID=8081 RepID=UPI0004A42F71|nr:PREDICTED: extended synaptotagmin-2-A-like isoform X1 [Poecilia reticulata]
MSNRMEGTAGPGTRANGPVPAPNGNQVPPPPGPPLAPEELEEEQTSSLADVSQMWIKFAKTFAIIFPIYILGYFEFSFSWVLIGLAMLFYWRKNHGSKDYRINQALAFLDHKDTTARRSLPATELPPWVHYPDVERVEWLNKTVKQMWPFISQFVDKLFRETIEPAVQGANPHLSTFCFTKIDMGDKPLRVNGVKVYTENVDKRQVIMDLQISFVGNTEIDVDIKKFYCRAGIKSIQLHGVLRVVMEPLLGDIPLIGALSVFFLKKPLLDINWTGLTNMLDIPGVDGLCDGLIQDIIYSYLVLPNRLNIPLVGAAELARIRFPIPEALIRIHFIEAQNLLAKDRILGIKGKSDPYGLIRVGPKEAKSKVIKDTVNPRWNEVHEFLMYDNTAKTMEIVLFDEDQNDDDKLGNVMIDLTELKKGQIVEEWFDLEDVPKGKLHLKMEWFCLLPSPEKLDQALLQIRANGSSATDGLSSAVLVVFLDSARNLSSVFEGNLGSGCLKERRSAGLVFCENTSSLYRTLFRNPLEFNQTGLRKASISKAIKSGKKVTSDPSPMVQFRVGHQSLDSKIKYKTNEPVWEENFTFLIHNPKLQELQVEVKDTKHECSLGTLALPLTRLLEAEDMTLSQRFPLKTSGPSCTLKMKMALRVLSLEKIPASPSTSTPSSVQVRKSSSANPNPTPQPSVSSDASMPPPSISDVPRSSTASVQDLSNRRKESELPVKSMGSMDLEQAGDGGGAGGKSLAETGKSTSYLAISGSQQFLNGGKEPTPSIASDISNPYAAQELQQRLQQLPNGAVSSNSPLGSIQLTIRYSTQRNRLIVVVHACRNLIAFTDHGSTPYARLYLLPDKRRSGRRKTHTHKKTQNPKFDETFEFSVTWIELSSRNLDVAVKNSGGLLSKHKGLLGKVLVDLNHDDLTKGWTQWYDLTIDGKPRP